MPRRRIISGVLYNFLGTYTSRYTSWHGYWLFGTLVNHIDTLTINLLSPEDLTDKTFSIETVLHSRAIASQLAFNKFAEQARKAQLPLSYLQSATLTITKSKEPRFGSVNGHTCRGHIVTFLASATTDLGRLFQSERSLFVAPHDSQYEYRSGH